MTISTELPQGRPHARAAASEGPAATLEEAVARAYRRFARQHPRWAASLFDEYFLSRHAAPLLARHRGGCPPIAPAELAAAWVEQLHWPGLARRADIAELIAVAADFLRLLDAQLAAGGDARPAEPPAAADDELGHVLTVYAEALSEGSNQTLDWLWLAAKLPLAADRRYCLGRALLIDPDCELARGALARLDAEERRGRAPRPT